MLAHFSAWVNVIIVDWIYTLRSIFVLDIFLYHCCFVWTKIKKMHNTPHIVDAQLATCLASRGQVLRFFMIRAYIRTFLYKRLIMMDDLIIHRYQCTKMNILFI